MTDRIAVRAEAIGLLRRALALMDRHDFGTGAAPHIDLGLHMLALEARAAGQASEDK